ncbi:MAG: hypothetical protein LBP92_08265 [Deltaproteobacteria bacterium]|nr:hypothetical protein [Deltaproteobacteria bacterium]
MIRKGLKPEEIIADAAYGGDDDWTLVAGKGIEPSDAGRRRRHGEKEEADHAAAVVPILRFPDLARQESMAHEYILELVLYPGEPVEAGKAGPFSLADFVSNVDGDILLCPMGWTPMLVPHKGDGGGTAYFGRLACLACPRCGDCPVEIEATLAKLTYRYK